MSHKDAKEVKKQAEKLERYINQYATRSFNVGESLGVTGSKILFDLIDMTRKL